MEGLGSDLIASRPNSSMETLAVPKNHAIQLGDMMQTQGSSLNLNRRASVITAWTALGLLVPAYVGLFLTGVPTIFCPFPVLTALPALMLAQWHLEYAVILPPVLIFIFWNPQLFRSDGKIPKRTYVLFALGAILNAVDLAMSWKWGLQYQGPTHTAIVCSINIAWIGFLGLALLRCSKKAPRFGSSLFLHWMLFAWLFWYAFPWLGELI